MPRKDEKPHNGYIAEYFRRSTNDDEKQQLSLETQERLADESWEKIPIEIRVNRERKKYEPESESGFKKLDKRVVYAQIIADAYEGKIFAVRAADFNRMGRNPKEAGEFVQLMVDGFIRYFIATSSGRIYKYDSPNDIADLMREGGVNVKYSMDLGKVVKDGMDSKAKSGGHASGPVQFGFKPHRYFDERGVEYREVAIDELRYKWIKPLFVEAALGSSLSELVLWAQSRAITLRATPKRTERPLSRTAIAGILHNPFYKGFREFDGIVTEWTKEPPVPLELWEKVQVVMSINYKAAARKKHPELRDHFLFDRCVFCAKCGNRLNAYNKKIKSNGKLFVYYECKKAQENGKYGCGTCIRQDRLQAQYQDIVAKIQLPEEQLGELRKQLILLHEEKMGSRKSDLEEWTEKYKKIDVALNEQVKALPKSIALGVAEFTEAEIERLKAERQKIKEHLDVSHTETTNWIDTVIRSYELLHLAQEAMMYGSPKIRASIINAITTNLSVDGKILICKLRSPFREGVLTEGRSEWWAILDSNQ